MMFNLVLQLFLTYASFGFLHSTLPRLEKIGHGYDLLYGNPFTNGGDPGFKSPIFLLSFNSSLTTPDNKYLIPDGTTAQHNEYYFFDKQAKEVTGVNSYQKTLKNFVDLGASIGLLENLFQLGSFTYSSNFEKFETTTLRKSKISYFHSARVEKYKLTMPTIVTLPLNIDFVAAVRNVLTGRNDFTWVDFFNRYGTHFVWKTTLGGRMTFSESISQEEYQYLKSMGIDIKSGVAAQIPSGLNISTGYNWNSTNTRKFDRMKKHSHQTYVAVGGLPNAERMQNYFWFYYNERVLFWLCIFFYS